MRAVCDVADRHPDRLEHRPWSEPLPVVLPGDGFDGSPVDQHSVGLLDAPDEQCRYQLRWSPDGGNLALYGSRGSGTTSTLLTIVDTLCRHRPPGQLHVYVLDTVGERRLDELGRLDHCGAVVRLGDGERLARLVGRLHDELARRRARTGGAAPPDIVWCVDGYGALRAAHDVTFDPTSIGDRLGALLAEGPAVGITAILVVHPGRAAASALAGCSDRWLFHLDDHADATAVGVRPGGRATCGAGAPGAGVHRALRSGGGATRRHPPPGLAAGDPGW